ncbi:J domain-containing protein [Niastella sp. OAS944]|uniref:J domain-containing protein n=1 Tax=Niastella sp. OAS944 TaxID=2664089 RepID=UPI0034759FE5|nr:DnaJ-class molecular chaperone [Chitinophagaceae bacterium OAS944]
MARGFLDGYKTYDTSKGFGNAKQWNNAFRERMSKEDATAILQEQQETPWAILGVSTSATKAEIKKAFRLMIIQWHPDKNQHRLPEAEAMSKKIIAAYTMLS